MCMSMLVQARGEAEHACASCLASSLRSCLVVLGAVGCSCRMAICCLRAAACPACAMPSRVCVCVCSCMPGTCNACTRVCSWVRACAHMGAWVVVQECPGTCECAWPCNPGIRGLVCGSKRGHRRVRRCAQARAGRVHTQASMRMRMQATTGEFLRLWRVAEDGVRLERLLNNVSRARRGVWGRAHLTI